MRIELPPCEVRRVVVRTFGSLGAVVSDSRDLDETIIVSDGKHVARSYRVDQLWAMWLFEHGMVQFYDSDGTMLRTVNLFEGQRHDVAYLSLHQRAKPGNYEDVFLRGAPASQSTSGKYSLSKLKCER